MLHTMSMSFAAILILAGAAHADPIEGDWKTADGPAAGIGKCGGGFCVVMKTGKYAGKQEDYLLASQYENGGFPQFFPLKKGYYTHITFNDDAMIHVLQVLRAIAQGDYPYGFADDAMCAASSRLASALRACLWRLSDW